jgi:glycosyltransferase involved in cell wall biosynthesis
LRVICIAPTRRTSGAAIYSKKLYSRIPSQIISGEDSISHLVNALALAGQRADLYHIQFEYRGFGGFGRSLLLLVVLSLVLGLRRPVVVTLHGILTRESLEGRSYKNLAFLAYFACLRLAAKLIDAIIVPSELMRTTLRQNFGVTNATVIPLGTDAPKLTSPKKPEASLVVSYGFVRPHKGIDLLIDAVAQVRKTHPDIKLTIVGGLARQEEAPYLDYLQRKVEQHSIASDVKFINRSLTDEEKESLFSEAVALVLPYTDRFVECSAVVHDFAGYGVPLICSEAPRFSELHDGFDCRKVNASPDMLAKAILTFLDNPVSGHRIAENLKLRVSSESWLVVAQLHLDLYARVCNFHEQGALVRDEARSRVQLTSIRFKKKRERPSETTLELAARHHESQRE